MKTTTFVEATSQPVLKDEHQEHAIPSEWRPVFQELARALATKNYTLAGVQNIEPLARDDAERIQKTISSYGETLIELPDDTWKTSRTQWMRDYWDAMVDLHTKESGRCDLVLSARVFESDNGYRFEQIDIYVP